MQPFTLQGNLTKSEYKKLMSEYLQRGISMFEKVMLTYASLGIASFFLKYKKSQLEMIDVLDQKCVDHILSNFIGVMADDLIKSNFLVKRITQ